MSTLRLFAILAALAATQASAITVHLSPTLTCVADSAAWGLGSVLTVAGLVCPTDAIFHNGFEVT